MIRVLRGRPLFAVGRGCRIQPLHEGILYRESEKVVASGSVVTGVVTPSVFLRRAVEQFEFFDVRLERIEKAELLFVQVVNEGLVEPRTVITGVDDVIRRVAEKNRYTQHRLILRNCAPRVCRSDLRIAKVGNRKGFLSHWDLYRAPYPVA